MFLYMTLIKKDITTINKTYTRLQNHSETTTENIFFRTKFVQILQNILPPIQDTYMTFVKESVPK